VNINPDPLMLRLAKRRLEKGLTMYQVANLVGVATNTIGKWEAGRTDPTWAHLQKWMAVMDMEVWVRQLDPEQAEAARRVNGG